MNFKCLINKITSNLIKINPTVRNICVKYYKDIYWILLFNYMDFDF